MKDGIPNPESGSLIFETQLKLDRLAKIGKTQYGNRRVAVALEGTTDRPEIRGHGDDRRFGLRTHALQRHRGGGADLRLQDRPTGSTSTRAMRVWEPMRKTSASRWILRLPMEVQRSG